MPSTLTPGYSKLGTGVIAGGVKALKVPPPPNKPPSAADPTERKKLRKLWEAKWKRWASKRRAELAFFLDSTRCAVWCELAGLDYDMVVSRLRTEGLLYHPKEVAPRSNTGMLLIEGTA